MSTNQDSLSSAHQCLQENRQCTLRWLRRYLWNFTHLVLRHLPHRPFQLPFEPYGAGEIERVIEMPWAISRCYRAKRLLEVGFARGEKTWIETLLGLPVKELHGIDILGPENWRHPELMQRLITQQADILSAPYEDEYFDCVLCISTIEHLGMQSATVRNPYGAPPWPTEPDWFQQHRHDYDAMAEMYRITAPGGRLLLTVPFGRLANYGSHIQYDWNRLEQLAELSGFTIACAEFFRYRHDGWYSATADELSDVLYQTDGALGATGLACLVLAKPARRT